MQQRNFIIFMVLSFLILFGWMWVQQQFAPPKQKDKTPDAEHVLKPPSYKDSAPDQIVQTLLTAASLPGDGLGPIRLATAVTLADQEKSLVKLVSWQRGFQGSVRPELARLATLDPGHLSPTVLLAWSRLKPLEIPVAKGPHGSPRDILLGNDDYFIQAVITTKGGGIKELTLTKFQAATEEGRPAFTKDKDGKKVKQLLHLVPPDPFVASFNVYDYSNIEKEEARTTLGELVWTAGEIVKNEDSRELSVWCNQIPGQEGLKIVRTYTLRPKDYHVSLQIELIDERTAGEPRAFMYQLAGPHGLPIEGEWYTYTYRNPLIGLLNAQGSLVRDLEETQARIVHRQGGDKIRPADGSDSFIQYVGVGNQFFASLIVLDNKQVDGVERKHILNYARPTLESTERKGVVRVIGADQSTLEIQGTEKDSGRWSFKLLPRAQEQIRSRKIKVGDSVLVSQYETFIDGSSVLVATEIHHGTAFRPHLDDFTIRAVSQPLQLKPKERVTHKYILYNGPAKVRLLGYFRGDEEVPAEVVTRYSDTLHLRTITDYQSAGFLGNIAQTLRWTDLLIQTTRLMHWLLDKLHWILPQWGLVIIALTIMVRGMMFPISRRQAMTSMRMQALAPELQKLKEKYKGDPQEQQKAVWDLYRKNKVNPLGGCLPVILQMPIFLGLYYCLQESIFFRLSSFLWIDNLAAPDMLFWWSEHIPWISDPDNMGTIFYLGPYFNLLPIIAVTLTLIQQKMMMPPATTEEQEMQQKMMKYMMVFMGFMFYKVAAGLVIYFIASSLWGLAEKQLLPKAKKLALAGSPTAEEEEDKKGSAAVTTKQRRKQRDRDRGKPRPEEPETAMKKVKGWWQEVLKQAKKK